MFDTIFKRKYDGKEYRNSPNDRRLSKNEAMQKAKNYRKYGYNARIARFEDGWAVYKSTNYSRR